MPGVAERERKGVAMPERRVGRRVSMKVGLGVVDELFLRGLLVFKGAFAADSASSCPFSASGPSPSSSSSSSSS